MKNHRPITLAGLIGSPEMAGADKSILELKSEAWVQTKTAEIEVILDASSPNPAECK